MSHNSHNHSTLRILACGGTFDKRYDETSGKLTFTTSHLPDIIRQARLTQGYECQILALQDSLDMDDHDRLCVLQACVGASENSLVIVHGTDTMTETASLIQAAGLSKTIVLTGAMVPVDITGTDALFNLGFACACASIMPTGVYVAMNGKVFAANTVQKNKTAGIFEAKN